jgi:hypothetical protein
VTDGVRTAYYDADCDGMREIWAIVLREIDRTQDPSGTVDQFADLFTRERVKKATSGGSG